MLERPLPRFVEVRRLANGDDGKSGRSATLNALFDEWNDRRKGEPIEQAKIARYGTIDWLFRQYKTEKAYTEKVSPRSHPDYERIRCRHLVGSCEPRVIAEPVDALTFAVTIKPLCGN